MASKLATVGEGGSQFGGTAVICASVCRDEETSHATGPATYRTNRTENKASRKLRVRPGPIGRLLMPSDPLAQEPDHSPAQQEGDHRQHIGHRRAGAEAKGSKGFHVDQP